MSHISGFLNGSRKSATLRNMYPDTPYYGVEEFIHKHCMLVGDFYRKLLELETESISIKTLQLIWLSEMSIRAQSKRAAVEAYLLDLEDALKEELERQKAAKCH